MRLNRMIYWFGNCGNVSVQVFILDKIVMLRICFL